MSMEVKGKGRAFWFGLFGVSTLAFLVLLNALGNGFTQDDRPIIEWNTNVHGVSRLDTAATSPYWPSTPLRVALYRPITSATYAVDWSLWGGAPFGFHLVNLLLHSAVTGLVFLLLQAMGGGVLAAAVGAAVFAVHPVHVEAVANVVGRAEILAALFTLAASLLYLRPGRGWGAAGAMGLLYFMAIGSKEVGIVLPGVLVLLHLREGGAPQGLVRALGERWRVHLALIAALGLHFGLRWSFTGETIGGDVAPWFWGEPASTRILTSIRLWPEYLRLLLYPVRLLPDYGPGVILPERELLSPGVLAGLFVGGVALAATLFLRDRARLLTLGILWFAVTVLPASGLLVENSFLLAERTLYLPSVGLSLALAGAMGLLVRHRPAWVPPALAVVGLLLVLGAGRTWMQNAVWRSDETLSSYLRSNAPESYRAHLETGALHDAAGRPEAALRELESAARLVPGHFNVRLSLGGRLLESGRFEAAAREFDAARRISPEVEAPHLFYLATLGMSGRIDEALMVADEVVRRFPENPTGWHFSANALATRGRLDEARAARLAAIRLDDGTLGWPQWVHLALIEFAAGSEEGARAALEEARSQAPDGAGIPGVGELDAWVRDGAVVGMPGMQVGGGRPPGPPV